MMATKRARATNKNTNLLDIFFELIGFDQRSKVVLEALSGMIFSFVSLTFMWAILAATSAMLRNADRINSPNN